MRVRPRIPQDVEEVNKLQQFRESLMNMPQPYLKAAAAIERIIEDSDNGPRHPNCGWMLTASHALLCRPLGINIMNTCQTHPGTSWRRSIGAGPHMQGQTLTEVLSFVIGCGLTQFCIHL